MDEKIMRRIKGAAYFNEVAEGFYCFQQDYSREPDTLMELGAYLEATRPNDRRLLEAVLRLARTHELSLGPRRLSSGWHAGFRAVRHQHPRMELIMITPLEMELAYYESELAIETSGSSYGSIRAKDHIKILTGQTLSQIGTRETTVNPRVKQKTG